MPIKPLSFKGEKKPHKKRKKRDEDDGLPTTASTNTSNQPPSSEDDTWVSCDTPTDLSGPTLLVLPTSNPPTALSTDAHGNIFASPLENLIEGDPSTAEPHDVRQVWIATKIEGLRPGEVSFKGWNGRYLGCDGKGGLSARREAIGKEEGFVIVEVDGDGDLREGVGGGRFAIMTAASTPIGKSTSAVTTTEESGGGGGGGDGGGRPYYIHTSGNIPASEDQDQEETPQALSRASKILISGAGTTLCAQTTLRIRMQARFKPRLKANREQKAREKVSRHELEATVGRRLEDDEVRRLKRARRNGTYHEEILDVRVKGKHDKFAS